MTNASPFQNALVRLGFDPGKIDGVLGHDVKAALRQYQRTHGIPADGFPTLGLLASMLDRSEAEGPLGVRDGVSADSSSTSGSVSMIPALRNVGDSHMIDEQSYQATRP